METIKDKDTEYQIDKTKIKNVKIVNKFIQIILTDKIITLNRNADVFEQLIEKEIL